jgi:hypothetical protein
MAMVPVLAFTVSVWVPGVRESGTSATMVEVVKETTVSAVLSRFTIGLTPALLKFVPEIVSRLGVVV